MEPAVRRSLVSLVTFPRGGMEVLALTLQRHTVLVRTREASCMQTASQKGRGIVVGTSWTVAPIRLTARAFSTAAPPNQCPSRFLITMQDSHRKIKRKLVRLTLLRSVLCDCTPGARECIVWVFLCLCRCVSTTFRKDFTKKKFIVVLHLLFFF